MNSDRRDRAGTAGAPAARGVARPARRPGPLLGFPLFGPRAARRAAQTAGVILLGVFCGLLASGLLLLSQVLPHGHTG